MNVFLIPNIDNRDRIDMRYVARHPLHRLAHHANRGTELDGTDLLMAA